jgi:hypothetical protein
LKKLFLVCKTTNEKRERERDFKEERMRIDIERSLNLPPCNSKLKMPMCLPRHPR